MDKAKAICAVVASATLGYAMHRISPGLLDGIEVQSGATAKMVLAGVFTGAYFGMLAGPAVGAATTRGAHVVARGAKSLYTTISSYL